MSISGHVSVVMWQRKKSMRVCVRVVILYLTCRHGAVQLLYTHTSKLFMSTVKKILIFMVKKMAAMVARILPLCSSQISMSRKTYLCIEGAQCHSHF